MTVTNLTSIKCLADSSFLRKTSLSRSAVTLYNQHVCRMTKTMRDYRSFMSLKYQTSPLAPLLRIWEITSSTLCLEMENPDF